MKKLCLAFCIMAVFAVAAWATVGTVESVPKQATQKPVKKEVKSLEAARAEKAAEIEALKAAQDALHPRHTQAPEHSMPVAKEPVRDPHRGLDDPVGSCCYDYGNGYYGCQEGLTEFECVTLNGGTWNDGLDCSACPATVYGGCCYQYFGYYNCYTVSEQDCYNNYLGESWTANSDCDASCQTIYGRCCYMDQGTCYTGYSQFDCEYYGGVWAEGLQCYDEPLCFPLGRCCYDYYPFCTDGINEYDCYYYYGGGGGGGEGVHGRGNRLDAIWEEGLACGDAPTCYPPTGRCCYELDGQSCVDNISQYECQNYYFAGTWTEGLTCNDPCPVLPTGRCCYENEPYCTDGITAAACSYNFNGTWAEGLTCADQPPCPLPTGRCCYGPPATPLCQDNTQAECQLLGGSWNNNLDCTQDCPVVPGALRVITVPVPSGIGVCISADCRGDLYYTNYGQGVLHKMNEFGALISSSTIMDAGGSQKYIDEMGWDEGRQVFWGGELGTNAIWTIDRTGLATYQFPGMAGIGLTDGCDFDATDGTVWHSTDVSSVITHFSSTGLLLGTLTCLDEFNNPEGGISGVEVGAGNTIFAGNSGIDDVHRNNKTTGAFVSRFDAGQVRCEGMECDAINFAPQTVLWVKDAYNNTVTAFEIEAGTCVCSELPDTCQFPYEAVDHGDLAACNYPTLVNNPAHALSGIAWLGPQVDGELAPEYLNADQLPEDDGVYFVDLPWNPCQWESLYVDVTAGPEYNRFEDCGGRLYLNGWKDGNIDGDFCDEIPCTDVPPIINASEWIIQDLLVTPGHYELPVLDPGVLNLGRYDGVFRFRLTSIPVGRYGFGLAAAGACTEQCGTFAFDILGEVEDYIIGDGQLDVELSSFDLVPGNNSMIVNWRTASETDNDHFIVMRDGQPMTQITTLGNNASGHDYTWTDEQLVNGTAYSYSLVAVDVNGAQAVLATQSSTPRADAGVVSEYALLQNFPNPFNPSTSIRFDLVDAGFTTLKVYNVQGREVATLINGVQTAGAHTVNFNATGLPSGLYIYRLEANGFKAEHKMLLLK